MILALDQNLLGFGGMGDLIRAIYLPLHPTRCAGDGLLGYVRIVLEVELVECRASPNLRPTDMCNRPGFRFR